MKKSKLFVLFTVASLVLSPSFASVSKAEDGNTANLGMPAFRQEMRGQREAFREQMMTERKAFTENLSSEREKFKAEVKAKKEEFKSANAERKATFCKAVENMLNQRFESAVTNLERFQTRLEDVVAKLDADGKDTTLAEDSLTVAGQKLEEAKAGIAEVRALVPENCESITSEIFEQIKLGAREAKDLLKETKESLRQVILSIKDLMAEGDDSENNNEDDTN